MFPNFPALKDFLAFWEKSLEGPLFAVTVALRNSSSRRTTHRRWRISAALIQLEQLQREREKLKIRISAPEHILRLGDLTARRVRRVQARAIAQNLRSIAR